MEYKLYVDKKCTVWERETFLVEADTQVEALEKIEKLDSEAYGYFTEAETLYDTMSELSPEENNGEATIEICVENENGEIEPISTNETKKS